MASSLLDPVAQHAADIVQNRGLGMPDRNALMAGVLSQRTPKLGLFSKDSKGKERDLRVFLFNCAIVLLTPNPNEKEKGWVLFCEPIPIEILTLRAIRTSPSSPATPQARRRSWFLDRVPAAPIPARAKTPPPLGTGKSRSSTPPSAASGIADDFSLVLSTLGRKDPNRTWPITLHAADAVEQRAWAQCVSARQEEIRVNGRDGSIRGWGLVPIKVAALGNSPVTCYVDYDEGFTKARLWGTPDGLYEHILNAPNQATAARKILDLPGVTHVLVMDFDERLMIVLVAEQTAYLAPFPGPSAMLEVSRLKKIGTNITHIAAGVLVSQPTPPANAAPSAFIDPEEKRERRKSATLTKPPPRGAVLSGASSTKSEVPSIARKDKESVKAPAILAPVAPAPGPVAAPSPTTTTRSSLAPPASPVKSKDKEKKPRRLSDIGIFSLWKRKPEKDKKKDKPRASTTSPSSAQTAFKPSPIDETPKPSLTVPRANQAATAKTESAVSSLKPSVDFEGAQLTKVKSSTLPMPMRLPSFEFDLSEAKDDPKANGNGTPSAGAKSADETGTLTGLGRPSIASQTVPSRASTGGSGLGRLARKLTTDSARTTSSKPKELGPPPTIQIALDFPSIAWPSLDAAPSDPFAASDFLADVQKDIGVLLSEDKVGAISEEPERASASGSAEGAGEAEVNETGNGHVEGNGEAKENGNGAVKEPASEAPAPEASESAPIPLVAQIPPQVPIAVQPVGSPRSTQPQHTRFLVLSKSTTLSTTVKLFTVGGLKIEDDGDIGGGRLTFYKEIYLPSQTYSIDMLKSRICFGSNDGFQIVDPTTLNLDAFLDPVEAADADGPLGFLIKHPRRPKARQVFRVDQKFLCCYDDFAFFLDKFGKRAREDWFVKWQGNPTSFAVQYPYLFAFEPEFTEIRHCATGELLQLIPQPNSKRLPAGDFIAPAQKLDGVPNRRISGETVLESEGLLYALRLL